MCAFLTHCLFNVTMLNFAKALSQPTLDGLIVFNFIIFSIWMLFRFVKILFTTGSFFKIIKGEIVNYSMLFDSEKAKHKL